jgi:hypothetical protein
MTAIDFVIPDAIQNSLFLVAHNSGCRVKPGMTAGRRLAR